MNQASIPQLMAEVEVLLGGARYSVSSEAELQAALAQRLDGFICKREVALTTTERIDFTYGEVGIEVKVDGSRADVLRQLSRYAEHSDIGGLVLVTTRARHRAMPAELNGKPLRVVFLGSPV